MTVAPQNYQHTNIGVIVVPNPTTRMTVLLSGLLASPTMHGEIS